jgi:P27 family predicted phage terminase small subunit
MLNFIRIPPLDAGSLPMMGRPPIPTPLKILKGTLRADRVNEDEPHPLAGIPVCPAWLDPVAKEKWEELVRVLGDIGLLTQADIDVMAQYCQAYARWREAETTLSQLGTKTVVGEKGRQAYKSLHAVMRHERTCMLHLSNLLGLDPSSRTRLKINGSGNKRAGVSARDRTKGPPPPASSTA